MGQRICEVTGCGKPHRARGFCSTHYNQVMIAPDVRHPRILMACVVCGKQVLRRTGVHYQTTCSTAHRTIVQTGKACAQESTYDWRRDAVKRARDHGCAVIETFDRDEIFDRDGWTCQACGCQCTDPNPYVLTAATVDHVVPLSLGGEHSRANAQTLCLSCNSRKRSVAVPAAA